MPVTWLAYGLPGLGLRVGVSRREERDLQFAFEELVGATRLGIGVDGHGPVREPGRADGVGAGPPGGEGLALDFSRGRGLRCRASWDRRAG